MTVNVEWDNEEKSALRLTYLHYWNWRDHSLALDVVNNLLATARYPIDLIIDLYHSLALPESAAWDVMRYSAALHPNWSGRTIVISPDDATARAILDAMPCRISPDEMGALLPEAVPEIA